MKSPSIFEHIKAIVFLPFMALAVIPFVLYNLTSYVGFNPLNNLDIKIIHGLGIVFLLTGIYLFVQPIILFIKIGKGTLAPWNPTKKMVVKGLYKHTRNPMITGVVSILMAEALLFSSSILLLWAICFFLINHIYFIKKEEPGLLKRFGKEYQEYMNRVPRWIPKLKIR